MMQYFKPNGYIYYNYMLCYDNGLIQVGFQEKYYMDALTLIYWLTEGFSSHYCYIGANFEKK